MNILTIIPARGGSKGLPGKNLKMIAGKPLLGWSIISAKRDLPDGSRVIVSTDCTDIARVAQEFGAEVPFLRPDEYSGDHATTESVIEHCLDWLESNEGYKPEYIILLQPTSPVRYRGRVMRALELLLRNKVDSILSVAEFSHFLWNKHNGLGIPTYDINNRPRRQDIVEDDKSFMENGSIYVFSSDSFSKSGNRLSGDIGIYIMSQSESYEIDSHLDFVICEAILNSEEVKSEIYY